MNEEKKTRKKDIIKNVAIIFLAIMLVLTFFSNTFMNYSLPQVSAVYAGSGTISEQIRGSGTVEPAESYEIKMEQTREIESVLVKKGDNVNAGDVLFRLADEDSEELDNAQTALDDAENSLAAKEFEYRKALIALANGSSYESEINKINKAEQELEDLKADLTLAQNGQDRLTAEDNNIQSAKDKVAAAKQKVSDAKNSVSDANYEVTRLNNEKDGYTAQLASVDTEDMLDLDRQYYDRIAAAKEIVEEWEEKEEDAQETFDDYTAQLAEEGDYEETISSKRRELSNAEAELNELYGQLYSLGADESSDSIYASVAAKNTEIRNLRQELSELATKSSESSYLKSKLNQAKLSLDKAEKNHTAAKDNLADVTRQVKLELKEIINDIDSRIDDAENQVNLAEKAQQDAEEELSLAQEELTEAQAGKTEAESLGYLTSDQLEVKISEKQEELDELNAALNAAISEDSAQDESARIDLEKQQYDINVQKQAVESAKAKVEKLKTEATDAAVTAKMGGVVSTVSITAGESPEAGTTAIVIDISDKGYCLEFSVKTDQAKKLKTGDKAEITSWYFGDDMEAVLTEIKTDTSNPQTMKTLVFTITGDDITTGQTISLAIGSKGQSYQAVVPNSAIREDSNGKFVLVMESKSGPLGNRYTAVRYDVEVLVSDDNNTAVNGVTSSEFVITTSSKPIAAGEQVRPAD